MIDVVVKKYAKIIHNLGGIFKNHKMFWFLILFAIVGTILVLFTKAATPIISIEAESSINISSPATKITDSTASGLQAIQFNDQSPSTVNEFVLVAAGDIACPPPGTKTSSSCHHRETANLIKALKPDYVLALGDLQYDDGAYSQYTGAGSYNDSWGVPEIKSITKPVPGNHEYHGSLSGGDAAGYLQYWGDKAGPPGKFFYSYNLGNWHIVALNSEISTSSTSEQTTWLKYDLEANKGQKCILAYWHQSRFSSGYHPSSTGTKPFWDELYAKGADLVLSGHSHNYERFEPQNPDGGLDLINGIIQITNGMGGDKYEAGKSKQPNQIVYQGTDYGILKVVLKSDSYDFQFIPDAGSTFTDSGTNIKCH